MSAYQDYRRRHSFEALEIINCFATGNVIPDIIFDITVDIVFNWMQQQNKHRHRLELDNNDFFSLYSKWVSLIGWKKSTKNLYYRHPYLKSKINRTQLTIL